MEEEINNVTRVEVIDHFHDNTGREFVIWEPDLKVELSFQDDGKTLKVFLAKRKEQ